MIVLRAAVGFAALWLAAAAPLAAAPAQPHWATVNGHAICYELRGAGRPILLLHGGGDSVEHSFPDQLDAFAAAHQVIAPEQVGQGRSPDAPGPLTYAGMTEDTAALLRQLHLANVDVVGFSDGGNIALMLAIRYPQLVRRLVISGANLDPGGLTDSEVQEVKSLAAHDGHEPAAPPLQSPQTIDEKLEQLWLTSPTRKELNPDLLKAIRQPVLVMAGDHDVVRLEHTMLI